MFISKVSLKLKIYICIKITNFLTDFLFVSASFSIIALRGTRDNKKKDRSMNFCRIFKKIFKSYR